MTQVALLQAPLLRPAVRTQASRDPLRWLVAPVAGHARALVALNAVYFGTCMLAAGYAFTSPALQAELTRVAGEAFSPTGGLGPLVQAYVSGNLLGAMLLTFLVNLVLGSAVVLTLPSAIIPFAGILMGVYRATLWGLLFAPTDVSGLAPTLWWQVPTIVLEGEAYVVAMLGTWLWWRPVFGSSSARWAAWQRGLGLQVRLYPLVAALLAVAAIYEWALARLFLAETNWQHGAGLLASALESAHGAVAYRGDPDSRG